MILRRLTQSGIITFSEYLDKLESEPTRTPPSELLVDVKSSESFRVPLNIQERHFNSRFAAAEYIYSLFSSANVVNIESDIGVWGWMTLFYFDELCPVRTNGERRPRERAAYVPEPDNFQRYYRHLLLGPYLIYRANLDNPKRAMAFLCKPLPIIDDIVAQLAADQEIISNKSIVELATHLYFDASTGAAKSGAGGKGMGSPRRLAAFMNQLKLTWDLYSISFDELLSVLPKEFSKFL